MFSTLSLNIIFLIILATNVHLVDKKEPSYLQLFLSAIGGGVVDRLLEQYNQAEIFISDEPADNKFNHLHEHKFATPNLLEKCIKMHDSEIVSLDLSRLDGRWDRHLISIPFPTEYEYGVAECNDKDDFCKFKYEPMGYYSLKSMRNDTKMLKSYFVANEFFGVRFTMEESMISIDYNSYFLKYSCVEVLDKVSGALYFQLRPQVTAQLDDNETVFTQILDNIPDKTMNKIRHLIPRLIHESNEKFENFGEEYAITLTKRLEDYRNVNQLSDKTDDQVFQFLDQNCLHFAEEELPFKDISTIAPSNWRLALTDIKNEKIAFNRMTTQRLSKNTFAVSLLKGQTVVAHSDHYYDKESGGFWTYTEGRRAFEVVINSDDEHRLTYCCEERQINGKLKIIEKLRYFSVDDADSASKKESVQSNFNQSVSLLKSDNLYKVRELFEKNKPVEVTHNDPIHEEL